MNIAANITSDREKVWILEMNSSPLKVEKKVEGAKKLYKFRGPCAEFSDELNENNRAYDEGNYDQKVDALQEKISKSALCGELDHNEDFLVSMKNASHKITELKKVKNGGTRGYEIEIELIPGTTQGDNAIALAEAGVPLFISSRASGYIDRSGNVTLEKIYTYDLVSEPGFKNAELVPVNESLQPKRSFKNSEVRIFRWTEPGEKGNSTSKKVQEIHTPNSETMSYASKAEVAALKREIEALKKKGVRAINESLQVPSKLKFNGISVEMLGKVPQKNDVITADSVDFTVKKVENIDESVDGTPSFKLRGTYAYVLGLEGENGISKVGYISKTGEFHMADEGIAPTAVSVKESIIDAKLRKVFEAIETKMNELVDSLNVHKVEQRVMAKYIDGLGKIVEHAINEHDKTVHFVNALADHSDNTTHVVNKVLENADQVTKHLNLVTESLDATQQFVNEHAQYSDAQTQILNTLISHSEKSTKHLNMLNKHADQLTTMVNVHESKIEKTPLKPIGAPKATAPAAVNESKTNGTAAKSTPPAKPVKGDLLKTTQAILAKVNSNKTEESRLVLESRFPFVKNLSEEELTEFRSLSPAKKQIVIRKTGAHARKANVLEAIRYVAKQANGLEFLELMSPEKKAEWERLPLERKQNIVSLFKSKNLRSTTAIEEFWETMNLKTQPGTGLQRRAITESVEKQTQVLEASAMGYSESDMSAALGL